MPKISVRRPPRKICITPFKLKKWKPSRKQTPPALIDFQDGPLAGKGRFPGARLDVRYRYASRCYSGTLPIMIRGEVGFYDVVGRWIPDNNPQLL